MAVAGDAVIKQLELLGFGKSHNLGKKKEMNSIHEVLYPDEEIKFLTTGDYNFINWLIVVTNIRLIFLNKMRFGELQRQEISYSQIHNIECTLGIMLASVTVHTSSGIILINNIEKPNATCFADLVAEHINANAIVHKEKDMSDIISQLERLAVLREKKFLTEEEFTAQKAKLLK